jgi:hypothetical protein
MRRSTFTKKDNGRLKTVEEAASDKGIAAFLCLAFFGPFLGGFGFALCLERYTPELRENVPLYCRKPVEAQGLVPAMARLPGPAVVVDMDDRSLSGLQQALPDEYRADTHASVACVVQLRYYQRQAGYYVPTGSSKNVLSNDFKQAAQENMAEVTLIDLKSNKVLARMDFSGGPPPETKGVGGEGIGPPVDNVDILHWLEQCARIRRDN